MSIAEMKAAATDGRSEVPRVGAEAADRYRAAEAATWRHHGALALREHWVEVPATGTRIRVLEHGEGRPVVFVHGGPNAGSAWAPLVSRMPGVRALVLDRPGCGLSDALRPFTRWQDLWTAMVALQAAVIKDLAGERADIVGSSFGGACALELTRRRPELVGRLVMEGAPTVEGLRLAAALRVLAAGPIGRFIARQEATPAVMRRTFRQLGHGALVDSGWPSGPDLAWGLSLMNETVTMASDVENVQLLASWRGFRSERLFPAAELRRITVPTLWLWGDHEPFGSEELGRSFAERMPAATFELVPGAGHLPWLDDPGMNARRVTSFLGDDQ